MVEADEKNGYDEHNKTAECDLIMISFLQSELFAVLLFLALFCVIIGGGIRLANRIRVREKEEKSSLFSEVFAEIQPISEDAENRVAWNGIPQVQPGDGDHPAGDWSNMTSAQPNASVDWNGTAGNGGGD